MKKSRQIQLRDFLKVCIPKASGRISIWSTMLEKLIGSWVGRMDTIRPTTRVSKTYLTTRTSGPGCLPHRRTAASVGQNAADERVGARVSVYVPSGDIRMRQKEIEWMYLNDFE